MSARLRYAWWVTLLVLVFAVALVVREARRVQTSETLREAAERRREQVRNQIKLAEQRLARGENEKVPPGASDFVGASGPGIASAEVRSTADATKPKTMSVQNGAMRPEVAEATDPELRALHLQVFDEEFAGIWGPLLRQLNLPEEKQAAFKAQLRAHAERRLDVTAVAGEQNLKSNDAAIQKMRDDDGALLSRQMRELLGTEDWKLYQEFRHALVLQPVLTDMAARTYLTATPLTFSESQQLLAILAANSERRAFGFVQPNSVKWDVALAQIEASGTFSPALIQGFRQLVAEHRLDGQIQGRIEEILSGPAGKGDDVEVWMPSFLPLRRGP
jgi:hypothetical protein